MKKHIPNILTLGNLFCGCLAIVCAFNNNLVFAAYLVGIAAILDFFDGFVARLLKVGGELGKQLDSLADMVTFGVVPGVVIYIMLYNIIEKAYLANYDFATSVYPGWHTTIIPPGHVLLPFIGFLITIFSALRLAKFNIDTRQTHSFIGVPTPANTILICSFPLIIQHQSIIFGYSVLPIINNLYFLIGLTIVMSYLLVAELPLFALKFKSFNWADNKIRYVFLIISLILLIVFQFIAIPFIIFLYILLSIVNNIFNSSKT